MSCRTTAEGWRPDTSMGGAGGAGGGGATFLANALRRSEPRSFSEAVAEKGGRCLVGATASHWAVQLTLCITL